MSALLAAPAAASDLADEWRGLHGRCAEAVAAAAVLDTDGLVDRLPDFAVELEEVEIGDRTLTLFQLEVARISARTVPTGVWARPDGRLELRLVEFPTRPGTRALCEVVTPRRAALDAREGASLADAFRRWRAEAAGWTARDVGDDGATTRIGAALEGPNPRGCAVVASLSFDAASGRLRSSVGERAGDASCGGPSLSGAGGLNPADVVDGEDR